MESSLYFVIAAGFLAMAFSFWKTNWISNQDQGTDRMRSIGESISEGAMAFSKGLGAVHSMSHAVGADQELRLHHGTLNGVILPTILRFNKDHVGDKYARISRAMGKDESTDLAEEIEKLNEKIGLPNGLAAMGVTEDMIPALVAHSMTDPSNMTTPRLPSQDEWEKLFLEAM